MIPRQGMFEPGDDTPVYVISVAAQLSGLHPQTLRQYDRLGLVSPGRTSGRGRRYSARDIAVLREVQQLSQNEGVNLAGVKRILDLQAEVAALRGQVAELENEVLALRAMAAGSLTGVAGRTGTAAATVAGQPTDSSGGDLLPMLPPRSSSALVIWRPQRHGR
jgi:MerR family transcriptional regulator/heat shock protein HspR